jgi:hypothetical protein
MHIIFFFLSKDDEPIEKNVMAATATLARPYEQMDLARRGRQTA